MLSRRQQQTTVESKRKIGKITSVIMSCFVRNFAHKRIEFVYNDAENIVALK